MSPHSELPMVPMNDDAERELSPAFPSLSTAGTPSRQKHLR